MRSTTVALVSRCAFAFAFAVAFAFALGDSYRAVTPTIVGVVPEHACSRTTAFPVKGMGILSTALEEAACYTYTVYTAPIGRCARFQCPPRRDGPKTCVDPTSKVEVPCADACCPVTPTVTSTTACPTPCQDCQLTEFVTVTTGCPDATGVTAVPGAEPMETGR